MKLKRFTLSLASLASLSLLVACSQRAQQVQQPVAQSQTQQTQQSQPAAFIFNRKYKPVSNKFFTKYSYSPTN